MLNWKQRKQLGIGKEYVDVGEVLRKEQYNLQTREQFKEFAKNSDTTFIEIGQGDFEMPEEMLGEIMVCIYAFMGFIHLQYISLLSYPFLCFLLSCSGCM